MNVIWEDEHYIYEEVCDNGETCTIRRIEKPSKKKFARKIGCWNFDFIAVSTSEQKNDIYEVHFQHKESPFLQWVYDFKNKKFEDWFQDLLKTRDKWATDEIRKEFTSNLAKNIETSIELYREIEKNIAVLRNKIEERKKLVNSLAEMWADPSDLKSELIEMYDLLISFQEKLWNFTS